MLSNTLLLDGPTTYLDLAYEIESLDLRPDLLRHRGVTLVAILHDSNQAARYADQLVIPMSGQVFAQGTPDRIVTASTISEALGVEVAGI